MKQRLLVMNGSKIVQANKDGGWHNQKVDKAGSLKPGIYNIYNAKDADKSSKQSGVIVHADKDNVYQQVGKGFVAHATSSFDVLPEIGKNKTISYSSEGKAQVDAAQKLGRAKAL